MSFAIFFHHNQNARPQASDSIEINPINIIFRICSSIIFVKFKTSVKVKNKINHLLQVAIILLVLVFELVSAMLKVWYVMS
jgi:hypothetical protein